MSESSVSVVDLEIRVPAMRMLPFVGLSMVPMIFNNDVLPPPDVPKTTNHSPFRTLNDTPRSAGTP